MGDTNQERNDQTREIWRVNKRLQALIEEFLYSVKGIGKNFHMTELTKFVSSREPCAPDSPGRILRNMRKKGLCAYEVIDRADSLYRVLDISTVTEAA